VPTAVGGTSKNHSNLMPIISPITIDPQSIVYLFDVMLEYYRKKIVKKIQ